MANLQMRLFLARMAKDSYIHTYIHIAKSFRSSGIATAADAQRTIIIRLVCAPLGSRKTSPLINVLSLLLLYTHAKGDYSRTRKCILPAAAAAAVAVRKTERRKSEAIMLLLRERARERDKED